MLDIIMKLDISTRLTPMLQQSFMKHSITEKRKQTNMWGLDQNTC